MSVSLLDDRLVRVRNSRDVVERAALPEILEALMDDDVLAFDGLQAHQQQAWICFLVQLGALAVLRQRENGKKVPTTATGWREALLALAEGRKSAWQLVVDELSEPAFMQSPVPEGSLEDAGYKADIPTPDALDILVTSKNHDVKMHRIVRPAAEHWIFALMTLQTMEGFLGRGNYGIVRMNGGFGNRPMVGLAETLGWGARFRRDLNVLLDEREDDDSSTGAGAHALLWLEPWDGEKGSAIPLKECDPYFIEICRRIRFTEADSPTCWRANTRAQRVVAPDELKGATGDPWTPVEKKGAKALTVGESGFHYDLLRQLLLGEEYAAPPALEFREGERSGAYLVARTLVRGQGKTDGLHRRIIPVPPKVSTVLMGDRSERERLAARAEERVVRASEVQRRVLRPAVATLVASGRDESVDWDETRRWTDAFDREVDASFFDSLWESVGLDQDDAGRNWETVLLAAARKQLRDAEGSSPIAAIHRWRAVSKARSIFEGQARRVLELAFTVDERSDPGGREDDIEPSS